MAALILVLNSGSSSLKFGAFEIDGASVKSVFNGAAEAGMDSPAVFDEIAAKLGGARPDVIGHRIVHGGPTLFQPTVVDAEVIGQLQAACAFAPLHGPAALALIAAARDRYSDQPHVACFDTGFHEGMPPVSAILPVPRALRSAGVRRYGFHGLSCQSVVRQLGPDLPCRLVIAHLGSGASVTAVRDGVSIDTSMGLTPSGGVVMATRSGDLDPGLLMFLMRERGMANVELGELIDRQSGLLGISGSSGDLRALRMLSTSVPDAQLAINIFCRSVAQRIAALIVSLGGIDMLVFTGGIGEHDGETRAAICGELAWAGVPQPGVTDQAVKVAILPPAEEEQIAREIATLLHRSER